MIQQEESSPLKGLIYWVGLVLVVTGALSLLYIAIIVVQMIQAPAESELIGWLAASFSDDELLLAGHIDEAAFEIHANHKLQFMLLGLFGLIALSILTRVVARLITSGVALIRFSKADETADNRGADKTRGMRGLSR